MISFRLYFVGLLFIRNVFTTADIYHFSPLSCNADIESIDCTTTTFSSIVDAGVVDNGEIVVPCGTCAIVDYTDGSIVDLHQGLSIEGKLYFPSSANVEIYTTHVFVTGVLEMDAPSSGNKVKFRLHGTENKYLNPVENNEGVCTPDEERCNLGKKPFVVVGGKLKIQGLRDPSCPSWVKLQDLKADASNNTLFNRVKIGSDAAGCWNVGDSIVLTTPDWDLDNSFETVITEIDQLLGEVVTELPVPSAFAHVTLETAPDYAVEVASISRSIIFEAEDDGSLEGGHLMIYHTPNVAQMLVGVEINNFGQQGNLGRYPIHFHKCEDVSGSVISKNVIHHSNQRGVIVHSTHTVEVTDNVIYEVFGHGFGTEDGIEQNNTFYHNLGVNARKVDILMQGEKDNEPSIYWITSVLNYWDDNVAAGSEASGFWFHTNDLVRSSSSDLPGGDTIKPMIENILSFSGNTAHGCYERGMYFYDPGWRPLERENLLSNCRVYRNFKFGFFIHANVNFLFLGGFAADNGRAFEFFKNENIHFDGMQIKGYTPEYNRVIQETGSYVECKNGLEFQMTRIGMIQLVLPGLQAKNLRISDFGTNCTGYAVTMNIVAIEMKHGLQYNSGDTIRNIILEDSVLESKVFSACNAMDVDGDNIAIQDLDGSLNPNKNDVPGFIVGDQSKMTTFAGGICTEMVGSCAHFCENVCLRNIRVNINGAFSLKDIVMRISSVDGKQDVAHWKRWDFKYIFLNTFVDISGNYGVSLPSGSYTFTFHKNSTGELTWPDWAFLYYDRAPSNCIGYVADNSITMPMPDYDTDRCVREHLDDGNFDDLVMNSTQMGGWQQNNLDLELVSPGFGGTGYALRVRRTARKTIYSTAFLSQYIDRSCMAASTILEFSADIRFEHTSTGNEVMCSDDCLKARIQFIYKEKEIRGSHVIGTISNADFNNGWYRMHGRLDFESYAPYLTDQVIFKLEHPRKGMDIILDNVSLQLSEAESSSPTSPVPVVSPGSLSLLENLALNKPAQQSSDALHYTAEKAVDDDLSTYTTTGQLEWSWWRVDLLAVASISFIKIYKGPEWDTLENAVISVSDYNMDVVATRVITEVNADFAEFSFDETKGSSVGVYLDGRQLRIGEVEIYGFIANEFPSYSPSIGPTEYPSISPSLSFSPTMHNLALNKETEQSTTMHAHFSGNANDGDLNSMSFTEHTGHNWWLLNLEFISSIDLIRVHPALEMQDAFLSVLNQAKDVVASKEIKAHDVEAKEFTFDGVEGAYVEITRNTTVIGIFEIEIYGSILYDFPSASPSVSQVPTRKAWPNIALNKPSSQSTTLNNYTADKANDGNFDTWTHTSRAKDNWWMVSLDIIASITQIKVFNRRGVEDRLEGAVIEVLDYNKESVWKATVNEIAPKLLVYDLADLEGSYVKIFLDTDYLNLGEVEVNGYFLREFPSSSPSLSFAPTPIPAMNLALGKRAEQSTTFEEFTADNAVDGDLNTFIHTAEMTGNWWMVSLDIIGSITQIKVFNRKGVEDRLHGAVIKVLDHNWESVWNATVTEAAPRLLVYDLVDVEGSYVNISLDTDILNIEEIEVYGYYLAEFRNSFPTTDVSFAPTLTPLPATNIALGKRAEQSTTAGDHTADKAIDGNINTMIHTTQMTGNWWMVSLDTIASITQIKVYNRADSEQDRLHGAVIEVLDPHKESVWNVTVTEAAPTLLVYDLSELQGSYVKISLDTHILNIGEVEVYGYVLGDFPSAFPTMSFAPTQLPAMNLALGKRAEQSTTAGDHTANKAIDGNINTMIHTTQMTGNWWMVSLDIIASITQIKIYNRRHVEHRLHGAVIEVLNRHNVLVWSAIVTEAKPRLLVYDLPGLGGSYINISLHTDYLHIEEVEVYGYVLAEF